MSFTNREDFHTAGGQGTLKDIVRIHNGKDHTYVIPAQVFLPIRCGPAFTHPKFSSIHRKPRNQASIFSFQPVGFNGAKSFFVKGNGLCTMANGKPWSNRGFNWVTHYFPV